MGLLTNGFINLSSDLCTWDPKNPLNINGIHAHCPPQSIDHIMTNMIVTSKSQQCFEDPVVEVKNREKVTLSDHYGVQILLSI